MEVHHHPHPEKKSFKEYLLEGLMIFLAVSMGFIAENIREKISDNQKEIEFIESLVEDLNEDQKYLTDQLSIQYNKLEQLDTLIRLVNTKGNIKNTNDIYYYGTIATRYIALALHTGTIDEIKNGGGLHLIKRKNIPRKIMEYYNHTSLIKNVEDRMNFTDDKYRQSFVEIVDPMIFDSISNWRTPNAIIKATTNPGLRNYSNQALATISGHATYMRILRLRIYRLTKELQDDGKNLLNLIQKTYHLD